MFTLMEEILWKTIEGYVGLYEVSSTGLIRSEKTQKLNKPHINHKGYYKVTLSNCGTKKNFRIHRLVAIAFIPNPENKPEVNHKDLNKLNNNVENLEWVTGE